MKLSIKLSLLLVIAVSVKPFIISDDGNNEYSIDLKDNELVLSSHHTDEDTGKKNFS
jgi:hypothetical protein